MTIAKRLALLTIVALIGMLVLGLFGLRQMSLIQDSLKFANENSIPSIQKVAEMEASYLRLRTQLLYHVASHEPEKKAEYEKQIAASKHQLDQSLKDYVALISDDKDKQLLENSQRLVLDYYAMADKVLALSRANQSDEARGTMVAGGTMVQQLLDNMNAHVKYNNDLAQVESQKADAVYRSGLNFAIAMLIGVSLITGTMGFLLQRHVSGSLQSMLQAFTRIEHDLDFTGRIPVTSRDEVGQAVIAFNRLIDRLQASF
ncbi:MAG: MCP four helix bundle domain-containing protein, partial [Betaproteobacteria bacterium]|nr:MCP four helix bundle domain-containing protein [Betaproteobacteria bacterium]